MTEIKLPYNVEAEAALLGAILIENRLADEIPVPLVAEHFYEPLHGRIFTQALKEIATGKIVTSVTLKPYFENDEAMKAVGGVGYLGLLTGSGAGLIGFRSLSQQIFDLAALRTLVAVGRGIVERALDTSESIDPRALVDEAERQLGETLLSTSSQPAIGFAQAWDSAIDRLKDVAAGKIETNKKIARPREWNELTGGLVAGNFILLGGRPSMGKTGVALSVARGAAESGHGVLFISREMSVEQLMFRMIADMLFEEGSSATLTDVIEGKLSKHDFDRAARLRRKIDSWPLMFEEPHHLNVSAIGPMVRKHRRDFAARGVTLALVVVDYLQLVDPPTKRGNREQEVSDISRTLKSVARETSTTLLALSQLNRSLEQREDKRPQMSDLRDSGSLEQDADIIVFAYRAEYYLERSEPPAGDKRREAWEVDMEAERNRLLLHAAKNRQGQAQYRKLYYFAPHQAVRSADYFDDGGWAPSR